MEYKDEYNGKIFRKKGMPGEGCTVKLARDGFVALIKAKDESIRIPFVNSVPSYGGDRNSMLVITRQAGEEKIDLYITDLDILKEFSFNAPPDFLDKLESAKKVARSSSFKASLFIYSILSIIIIGVLGVYLISDVLIDKVTEKIPRDIDIKLGKSLSEHIISQKKSCKDKKALAFIDSIGNKLVSCADTKDYQFKFHLVVDPQVNAFALPGGEVFVLSGLIHKAERPEEVAGVLAHEIQHVLKRHAVKRVLHMLKWEVMISIFFGDTSGVSEKIVNTGVNMAILKNSREDEFEADDSALAMLLKAGINPEGLPDFLERLTKDEKMSLEIMSTHPDTSERVKRLREKINSLPGPRIPYKETLDWKEIQSGCDK